MKLGVSQLRRLTCFLEALTQTRRDHDVRLDAFGPVVATLDGNSIEITWDAELDEYVIDDQVGR